MRNFLAINKWLALIGLCTAMSIAAYAQTPTTSTVNLEIGAGAFGLGTSSQATAASDVQLQLNPGFKQTYASQMALLSDNVLWAGGHYFGGGLTGPVPDPFPSTSVFASLVPYWRASIGAVQIGSGSYGSGFIAGGGLDYRGPAGLNTLFEVDDCHFVGAPWGNNQVCMTGSINWIFGKSPTEAAASLAKKAHKWIRGPWHK